MDSTVKPPKIIWVGNFLDGKLFLGASEQVPNIIFYSIVTYDLESEGYLELAPETIPDKLEDLVEVIISLLTQARTEHVLESRDEYFATGGTLN